MITYLDKDITTIEEGIIAHGVNCQGVMGSGVAKAIRDKWPDVYKGYMNNGKNRTGKDDNLLGSCHLIQANMKDVDCKVHVANCYTQRFYGRDGKKYADQWAIIESLKYVYYWADLYELDVFMPKIGAGLGGLDWETEVLPIVEMWDKLSKPDTYICVWGN